MSMRVHVGGRVVDAAEARISVLDRGFLYGDSVYETAATVNGRLFALPEHLDRLQRSAARIGLPLPERAHIESAVRATLEAAGNAESRVRIIVTRGAGGIDLDPASAGRPELVVIVGPRNGPTPEMYEKGVAVQIVSVTRNDPRAIDPAVKSGNYLNNVLALGEARRASGAHEAILCAFGGSIAEGASSNVFVVVNGEVQTPSLAVGILDGITRSKVIGLCQSANIPHRELDFLAPGELRRADEVFLTSAVRAVLPVTRVDDQVIGQGGPGPVTRRLMALYQAAAEAAVGNGRQSS